MGTVNNDMMPLYGRFIEAFADTPYQMILSAGDVVRLSDFGQLPANISVYRRVDQIAVLSKADVFFSHCGMNPQCFRAKFLHPVRPFFSPRQAAPKSAEAWQSAR